MEEQSSYSLHICRDIVHKTLLSRMAMHKIPSSQELKVYSLQHSECLSDALLLTSNYKHDDTSKNLAQDTPIQKNIKKTLKLSNLNSKQQSKRPSFKKCLSKDSKGSSSYPFYQNDIAGLKLVPLKPAEDQSEIEQEEDDMENRMRDMKIHQQFVRTLYAQNQKQNNKKMFTIQKSDNKNIPKVPIYDFNGSLVPPLKTDNIRLPVHFQELEVQVQSQPEQVVRIQKKMKVRQQMKFQSKKQQLKPLQSIFLRELTNVEWVEGVEIQSHKEQCRKIHGNQNPQPNRKKKIDLFKKSQKPVRIRLDELQSYKTQGKTSDQCIVQEKNQVNTPSHSTILVRDSSKSIQGAGKTIQIANNRALQFLMKQQMEVADSKGKKSQFSLKKKAVRIMSFHQLQKN